MLFFRLIRFMSPKKWLAAAALAVLVGVGASGMANAQGAAPAPGQQAAPTNQESKKEDGQKAAASPTTQGITQGYGSDGLLKRGMVVVLKDADPTVVQAATRKSIEKMFGVVVNANESPLTLAGENQPVYVATVGRYEVLVSDQAGAIKPNDYVTVSHLGGIAMKATDKDPTILGRAVGSFDGKSNVVSTSKLTDTRGGQQTIKIGMILVDVAIGKNPLSTHRTASPQVLSDLSKIIAGKEVSPAKVYLSAAIFLVGTFVALAVIYSGVRSSIVAIGRNPLSKKSILRSLASVIFTGLIIFIIAIGAVYLMLKI